MDQEVSLIIHVKIYGLITKSLFVSLYKGSIETLDKYTLAYQNKQAFFDAKKVKL